MEQQALLPLGEEEPDAQQRQAGRRSPRRPWVVDERTRSAARRGIADARRALAGCERPPANAA